MYINKSLDVMLPGLISPEQFTAIAIYLSICGVVGLLVNSVTFLVLVTVPSLRCPTNVFVMAVLCCDIFMSTVGISFEAVSSAYNSWIFGPAGCFWHGFFMSFLGYASIYLLAAISVERYLLITNPFSRPRITNRRAIGITLACVALAMFLAVVPLFGWSSYRLEGVLISCSVNWQSDDPVDVSYIITVFIMCLIVPVAVMVFSYSQVFLTVHSLARNQLWGKKSHATRRNLKMEYRTTRNILILIGAFLLCWTPYATVSLWAASSNPGDIAPLVGTIPSLIAKSSVVWNPVIYVFTNRQFRARISSILPCHVSQQNDNVTQVCVQKGDIVEMNLLNKNGTDERISQSYQSIDLYSRTNNGNSTQFLSLEKDGQSRSYSSVIVLTMDNPSALTDV